MRLKDKLDRAGGYPSGFHYMRFVLATLVILNHSVETAHGMGPALALLQRPYIAITGFALPMFFSMSGFLVANSLEKNKTLLSFYGLRFMRLGPALAVEVILSALLLGMVFTRLPLAGYFHQRQFWSYFLNLVGDIHYQLPGVFTDNPTPSIVNSQLWTVPVELKCYAALSIVAMTGIFARRLALLALVVGVQIGALVYVAVDRPWYGVGTESRYLIGAFCAGVLLFKFRDKVVWDHRLGIAAGLVSMVLLATHYGGYLLPIPIAYYTVYWGTMDLPKNRFIFSGDYSYGMYLYGYPLQQAFTALGPWTHHWQLNFAVVYPVSIMMAIASWWGIERPAFKLRRHVMTTEGWALRVPVVRWHSRRVFAR